MRLYIAAKMTHPGDMAPLTKKDNITMPTIRAPKPPVDDQNKVDFSDPVAKMRFEIDLKEHTARSTTLEGNLIALYNIIWGQCSEAMQAKLRSLKKYEQANTTHDCVRYGV